MRSLSRSVSAGKLWLGAAAVITLAVAGTALAAEGQNNDEAFAATSIVTGFGTQHVTSFDIGFIDTTLGQYLLADRTNAAIDVVGLSSNNLDHQWGKGVFIGNTGDPDTSGPNGVLTVNHNEVWAGDGPHATLTPPTPGVSNLLVFDAATGVQTHTINTSGYFRVDEGCFDPRDRVTLWANDAEHDLSDTTWPFVSFVATGQYPDNSKRYTVLGKITMDGTGGAPKATNGIEQCQWSAATGKFYVNIPEVNGDGHDSVAGAVLVIDPKTMQIEQTWMINHDACAGPQGMAIGPSNQILLGCNAPSGNGQFSTVIINQNSGAITRVIANESGSDEVWFNPDDGHYFLGRSAAAGPATCVTVPAPTTCYQQLGVIDSMGKRADQSVATAVSGTISAHSVAAVGHTAYVPIPGKNTANPNGASTICGSLVGGSNTQGCIALFTTSHDDRSRVAHERDQDDRQE